MKTNSSVTQLQNTNILVYPKLIQSYNGSEVSNAFSSVFVISIELPDIVLLIRRALEDEARQ